jgi:PAS domain S-box-containing protein
MKKTQLSYSFFFLLRYVTVIFFLLFTLFSYSINGSTNVVDSLNKIINNPKHDTALASAYVGLSEELYSSNIDTIIPLCEKAISIADKYKNASSAEERKSYLRTKANAINNIGYAYKQKGNYSKAIEWYNKSLKLKELIDDKKGIATSLNNIALVYNYQGDILKAIEFYKDALKIQNEINDFSGIAITSNNLGFIYYNQGDVPRALEWYYKSLKIREENGIKRDIAVSYNNIGNVFNKQGEFPKALEFYNKSLKVSQEIGDKKIVALSLSTLGDLYKNQGQSFFETNAKNESYAKSKEYYESSLNIYNEFEDKEGIARILNNLSFLLEKQVEKELNPDSIRIQNENIKKQHEICLSIWKEIGNKQGVANSFYNLSGLYLKRSSLSFESNKMLLLNEAEKFSDSSLQISIQLAYPDLITNASERLGIIYRKMGEVAYSSGMPKVAAEKYQKALEMQDLYKINMDRINNVEMQKLILKKQMQLDFKQKEREGQAKQQIKDEEARIEKERQFVYLLIVILILLVAVGFSFYIFKNYQEKKKLNIELEKLSIVASETDNGVIICSPNGNLEWINQGMFKLLGYTLDEWRQRGNTLQEISYNNEIVDKVNKSIESKQTVSYESINFTKDGRKLWIQSTLTPILNKHGKISKLVVIDTDITERKFSETIIEVKSREITDSIHSAKRIQHALLASDTILNKYLPEYFVLHKPKDIVSGDFYWASVIENKFIMITADCTGHGVPGAFMSLLNMSYLNEAIIEKKINAPEKILDYVRDRVINSLNPEGADFESKEGMDAVLCVFDFKGLWLRFSCANNPLWVVRKNEVIRFKPDKMPIGMHHGEQKPFTAHTLGLRKGDIIYTFTDGYADQFGGQKGKKFKYKALKDLLLSIQDKSMAEQKTILENTFESWRTGLEQVDDVLIIGIRI